MVSPIAEPTVPSLSDDSGIHCPSQSRTAMHCGGVQKRLIGASRWLLAVCACPYSQAAS